MSDSGSKLDKPFEAHLTFAATHAEIIRQFAKADNGWSYSELFGDPAMDGRLVSIKRCYLTAYDNDFKKLGMRMLIAICDVGVPVMRAKIEFIVTDTAGDVDRQHNIVGYGL